MANGEAVAGHEHLPEPVVSREEQDGIVPQLPLLRGDTSQENRPPLPEEKVTHDVREAVVLGHTITLMTQGRVVQDGTFEDLRHRPTSPFVTEFLRAQAPPTAMVGGA